MIPKTPNSSEDLEITAGCIEEDYYFVQNGMQVS